MISTRHVERALLVGVGVFVLVVGGILVARSRSVSVEPAASPTSEADLRIKDVEIEEVSRGVRWRLTAEHALTFQDEGRTSLRRLAVEVQEGDRSWTIVGDEGDVFQKEKNVEVRDNVVVTSSDGLRLETSVLRWHGEERRLWTDAPVVLSRDRSEIRGTGLEVRLGDEHTTVRGRVHARFRRGDLR